MPDWLRESFATAEPIDPGIIAVRLVAALALGLAIAGIYRFAHGREARETGTLATTLVLLAVLLAMVSMVIGESIALAFGLVGALSIVRFRTTVEDTRDTAFVIFAVIVGMAAGKGLLAVSLLGVPVVGAAAIVLARVVPGGGRGGGVGGHALVLRLALGQDASVAVERIGRHATRQRLVGAATARQGMAMEYTFRLELRDPERQAALVAELNGLEGVQSVELREV